MVKTTAYFFVLILTVKAKFTIFNDLNLNENNTTALAIKDIIKGIPIEYLITGFDESINTEKLNEIFITIQRSQISLENYNLSHGYTDLFNHLNDSKDTYSLCSCLFICNEENSEDILLMLYDANLIKRNLLYIFYWEKTSFSRRFVRSMHESMRIVIITNPKQDVHRVYYNQATSHRKHNFKLVNWWIGALNQYPTLPSSDKIYSDFKGRIFQVPVVHKPPWHFIKYDNDSTITVQGGRDHKLLKVLAEKLNFRFEYFDPPDHSQGSSIMSNGTFTGILGLISRREADFFLGDVGITLERSLAIEFSIFTLSDSGAFVTHSPSQLNEALALIRSFQWQVWPLIIVVLIIAGPVLYFLISTPKLWNKRTKQKIKHQKRLLYNCVWYTTGIFMKQAGRLPSQCIKARIFITILTISVTYVISDVYSANLTSLLAKPAKEKPITSLSQLEQAMINYKYKLFVERQSSSYTLLENGTGIYGRLWFLMQKQTKYLVNSVEEGIQMVRNSRKIAVIGGRETLYFDTRRFGVTHFHMSEKLHTGYSAIAFQTGCPYIENFNKIIIKLFEAGILTKMTEEEYEKLGKRKLFETSNDNTEIKVNEKPNKQETTEEQKSKPISLSMIQGAFYILISGYIVSGFIFLIEIKMAEIRKHNKKIFNEFKMCMKNMWFCVYLKVLFVLNRIKIVVCKKFNQIVRNETTKCLEYIE